MTAVRSRIPVPVLLLLLAPRALLAHAGQPPAPHDLWRAWSAEPAVLLGIGLGALLYRRGLRALWARAGVGRGIREWQATAYTGGVFALFVALVSPLDALGSALFSGHMIQHLVLMLLAAPLLVLGEPLLAFTWALPSRWRRGSFRWQRRVTRAGGGVLIHPLAVWVLYAAALWVWHLPVLYQATLWSDTVHALQHGSFLGTSLLFWWTVLEFGRRARGHGAGILYVFTAMMQGMALGVIIATAGTLLYPAYATRVAAWGITPLEDQQLAGFIMWMPPGLLYVLAVALLLVAWLRAAERRAERRDGLERVHPRAGDPSSLARPAGPQ